MCLKSEVTPLNKFTEKNTLIKRNLNFKQEVKSHNICFQPYCNNKITSILLENKTGC